MEVHFTPELEAKLAHARRAATQRSCKVSAGEKQPPCAPRISSSAAVSRNSFSRVSGAVSGVMARAAAGMASIVWMRAGFGVMLPAGGRARGRRRAWPRASR